MEQVNQQTDIASLVFFLPIHVRGEEIAKKKKLKGEITKKQRPAM